MNIEAKELSKIYGSGESRVVALDKVNLEIASSDFISIMGPSGSGKSTLLHLLSGLDKPTSGSLMEKTFIVLMTKNCPHFAVGASDLSFSNSIFSLC